MLIYKLRKRLSPHMEHFIGYRMVLMHEDKSVVAISSDYSSPPSLLKQLTWVQEHARNEHVTFTTRIYEESEEC